MSFTTKLPARRFRLLYSLRVALAIAILAAVMYALAVPLTWYHEQPAIEKINAWKGKVTMYSIGPDWPRWKIFDRVNSVELNGVAIGDDDLACFGRLSELQGLALVNARVSDEGLSQLGRPPKLSMVSLWNTPVTDAGLAHLGRIDTLTNLWLSNTQVTDEGVRNFQKMRPGCRIQRQ